MIWVTEVRTATAHLHLMSTLLMSRKKSKGPMPKSIDEPTQLHHSDAPSSNGGTASHLCLETASSTQAWQLTCDEKGKSQDPGFMQDSLAP